MASIAIFCAPCRKVDRSSCRAHNGFDAAPRRPLVVLERHVLSAALFLVLLPSLVAGGQTVPQPTETIQPTPATDKPEVKEGVVIATGQITDAIGAGQKDVSVKAYLKNEDGSAGAEIAVTQTNDMGDFSLSAEQSPGNVEIVVRFSKDQFSALTRIVTFEDGKPAPYIGEALEGNLKINGKVLNAADKKPVAAEVLFQNMFTSKEVQAGADGQFVIDSLSPGPGQLEVTQEGFGRERRSIRVPVEEALTIELKPERTVHFTVTDKGGTAISGAAIECTDAARSDHRTAITGDDGTVEVRGLHFDAIQLKVEVSRDGFVSIDYPGMEIDLPPGVPSSRHQLTLDRAGTISGSVRDAKSRAPLYGARVFAGETFGDFVPHDWTDTSGNFQLNGVRPGTCPVTVYVEGHAPDMRVVEVTPQTPVTIDFELGPPSTVRGTVKTPDGTAMVGVELAVTRWRDRATLGLKTMTDHEGKFVIENAPADEFTLSVLGAPVPMTRTIRPREPDLEFVVEQSAFRPAGIRTGDRAPDITMTTLTGEPITLSKLKGKTVLLDFWATWCGPCVAEIPSLIDVHERFRGRNDFVLIGISRDFEEPELRDFLKSRPKMTWPQVFGEIGGANAAARAFGVGGIPAVYLIDTEGRVVATDLRGDQIAAEVDRLLKKKDGP